MTYFSWFLEFECTLRISENLSAYGVVLLIGCLYVNVALAQPLDQYVSLIVHFNLDPLIDVSLSLLGLRVPHRIVEAAQAYPVSVKITRVNINDNSRARLSNVVRCEICVAVHYTVRRLNYRNREIPASPSTWLRGESGA